METHCADRVLIRKLEPEEFPVLAGVHEGFIPPNGSVVLVAESGEEIVGRIFLMAPTHVEGPWIREDRRGGLLAKQLMDAAANAAKACGITKLFAYASDIVLARYLARLGYRREPFTVWSKEI